MVKDSENCAGNCQSVKRLYQMGIAILLFLVGAIGSSASANFKAAENNEKIKGLLTISQFIEYKESNSKEHGHIMAALMDIKKELRGGREN